MGKVSDYINENIDIRVAYEEIFGKKPHTGKIYCVFHDNRNTPAAKIYGNIIRCFSCNRSFTTYDLLKKYNPSKITEIAETVLIDVVKKKHTPRSRIVNRNDLDMSQPIAEVVKQILE